MKKIILFAALAAFTGAGAQTTSSTIRITGTRFTFPVFQQWISEYAKVHPEVSISVGPGTPADSADIVIASHRLNPGDVKEGRESVVVARYVQLPVVNSQRSDLNSIAAKGFTAAAFKQIYFSDGGAASYDQSAPFTVYKRQKAACSSVSFANHFGEEHADIKGKPVPGDDQDLLNAVQHDPNAISHNSLGVLYNLKTRKLNDGIAIIPIDLNENGKTDPDEKIYATLDDVLAFAETTRHPAILVEDIHVIFSSTANHAAVADFLQWVLVKGSAYNHAYGLINLDPSTARKQQDLLRQPTALSSQKPLLSTSKN